jgi:hypothetical protein
VVAVEIGLEAEPAIERQGGRIVGLDLEAGGMRLLLPPSARSMRRRSSSSLRISGLQTAIFAAAPYSGSSGFSAGVSTTQTSSPLAGED